MEISTSGANPSASAATSLIPTRGPRRAAVVACSAGLVRDLISTCIALRKDKASLSGRLAEAQRQQQQQQGASGGSSAHLQSDAAGAAGHGETTARKKHDDGGSHGRDVGGAGGAAAAGVASSAKVFGQLLSLSVFGFLGPQSLEEASKVSREWRDKCTWDCK